MAVITFRPAHAAENIPGYAVSAAAHTAAVTAEILSEYGIEGWAHPENGGKSFSVTCGEPRSYPRAEFTVYANGNVSAAVYPRPGAPLIFAGGTPEDTVKRAAEAFPGRTHSAVILYAKKKGAK